MIKEHRRLALTDFSNRGNEVVFEVNWNSAKRVKGCKHIKLSVGDKEAIISRDHLWGLLFMISEEEQQEKMIPRRVVPIKSYNTVIQVMAKQDFKKGQLFNLPISVSVNQMTGQMTIKP